jgi:hypothetical protein
MDPRNIKLTVRWNHWVLLLIIVVHVYFLFAYMATFWIDSIVYVQLAEALRSSTGLSDFYSNGGSWVYGYIQPGLSLIWLVLDIIPANLRWPCLAVFQHGAAVVALYYCWTSIRGVRLTTGATIPVILLLFLPYYQTYHNALLTESLTSSALLFVFAAASRIAHEDEFPRRDFIVGLVFLCAVTQLRSYWGAAAAMMIVVALMARRNGFPALFRRVAILTVVAGVSAVAFPVYRYIATGEFFLTRYGLNAIQYSYHATPGLSQQVREQVERQQLPQAVKDVLIKDERTFYLKDMLKTGRFWRSLGLSGADIARKGEEIGRLIAGDPSWTLRRRVFFGVMAAGAIRIAKLYPAGKPLFRGMDAAGFLKHQDAYNKWQNWLLPRDYRRELNSYFSSKRYDKGLPFEQAAQDAVKTTWEPYVTMRSPIWRDPLRLGSLPPDLWLAIGVVSALVLLFRDPPVGVFILILVAMSSLAGALTFLVNTRYVAPLFPVYLMAGAAALVSLGKPLRNDDAKPSSPGGDEERSVPGSV